MTLPTRAVRVTRLGRGDPREEDDRVAIEEPLEIRIAGDTIAITMRTPGHDRELVLGFLWAEGIIESTDDVLGLAHCGRTGDEGRENTLDVTPAPHVKIPDHAPAERRGTIVTSACGVCGRKTIDDLLARFRRVDAAAFEPGPVVDAMARLRERQPVFAATGGTHAASLVARDGHVLATHEDVGRHNAVDKVIGARIRARAMPLTGCALLVSGRASFEIVQKAMAAAIPIVASVSAPSSLAIELARAAGITLFGFVRDGSAVRYATGELSSARP